MCRARWFAVVLAHNNARMFAYKRKIRTFVNLCFLGLPAQMRYLVLVS